MPRVLISPIEMTGKPSPYEKILSDAGLEIVKRPPDLSLHDPMC